VAGDYNTTPDRHLGAASIERLRPTLLITEATCVCLRAHVRTCDQTLQAHSYATTIRDSKRARERNFLKRVHACVEAGGKVCTPHVRGCCDVMCVACVQVLIPVFALGRAQELCILIDTYWQRMGLDVPIYFSAG
jgi:integrator complex subunit 11